MPTVRQPMSLAIWPTAEPTAPAAVETTTVSPGRGCAEVEQSEIGGDAVQAEDAERQRQRQVGLAHLARDVGAVRHGEVLPAEHAHHAIALGKARVARGNHAAGANERITSPMPTGCE